VSVDAIQQTTGEKKYVSCNFVNHPAVWHDRQPFNLFAKMTDGLANRKMWIQRPMIRLIEFQFRRQHASLRRMFQTTADDRWLKHI
jgi:hypothetical protein